MAVSDNKLSSVDDRGDFSNEQLFVIHWLGSVPKDNVYTMSTADKKQFLTKDLNLTDNQDKAAKFALWDNGNGQGYTIQELDSKKYFDLSQDGTVSMKDNDAAKFAVASVSL